MNFRESDCDMTELDFGQLRTGISLNNARKLLRGGE